jgi:hypothetical protein
VKELNLDKPCELIDYKLEPVVVDGVDTWNVNLLRSPYDNVVIRYNNVSINESVEQLTFNFDVVDTPDSSVYNIENTDLQQFAADVLEDILEAAINTRSLQNKAPNDRNQSTTDDPAESTD